MGTMSWIQWLGATATAAIAGVFALFSYMHSDFTTSREFRDHQKTVHVGALEEGRYLEDLRDIRKRLDRQDNKLDKILDKLTRQ